MEEEKNEPTAFIPVHYLKLRYLHTWCWEFGLLVTFRELKTKQKKKCSCVKWIVRISAYVMFPALVSIWCLPPKKRGKQKRTSPPILFIVIFFLIIQQLQLGWGIWTLDVSIGNGRRYQLRLSRHSSIFHKVINRKNENREQWPL